MKKIIIPLLFLLLIPLVSADFSYYVQLNYNNEEITYQDLEVIEGNNPDFLNQPENSYKVIIVDFYNNTLFSFNFEFPLKVYDLPGIFLLNETSKIITIPYFNNGTYLRIYNLEEELKLQIDISKFALCNQNFKCESSKENHETCSLDCISGGNDNFCDYSMDGVCDPDCKEDFECKEPIEEEKIINELINKYENENEFYSQESYYKEYSTDVKENIQEQIKQREERINNLKKKQDLENYTLILVILLLIIGLASSLIILFNIFKKKRLKK